MIPNKINLYLSLIFKMRSKLQEIEDLNFAINKIIYKGTPQDLVIEQLRLDKKLNDDQISSILNTINIRFNGVKRIKSSINKRIINHFIDLSIIILFLFLIIYNIEVEISIIIFISFYFLYYIIPELIWGQTIGKLITNTIVVTNEGRKPDLLTILIRTFARIIPLDHVFMFWSENTLHDKLANTQVVNKKFWLEQSKDNVFNHLV